MSLWTKKMKGQSNTSFLSLRSQLGPLPFLSHICRDPFYLLTPKCIYQWFLSCSIIFFSFLTTRYDDINCLPQCRSMCIMSFHQLSAMSCPAIRSSTPFDIQLHRSLVGLESRMSRELIPIDFSRSRMGLEFYRINFWKRHSSRELVLMRSS